MSYSSKNVAAGADRNSPGEVFAPRVFGVTLLLAGALSAAPALAQTPQTRPDAGQTLRESEKSLPTVPAAPEEPTVFMPVDPRVNNGADSISIGEVKEFRITGAGLIPSQELMVVLEPWLHRPLKFSDLKDASDAVSRAYRDRGYPVVRAYIPEQTLENNVVEITVMASRLGSITLNNNSNIATDRLKSRFDHLPAGSVLRTDPLERSLLLVQDLAGVASVSATLQPGENAGETNAVVSVERAPLIGGSADLDNYGNRYTGAYRAGATINVNSPAGYGDQLIGRVQATDEKLLYGRFSYRFPIGNDGLAVGAGVSKSRYQLGGSFAPLDANGTARASNVFVSYPFIRSRLFSLAGTATLENKALEDRIDAIDSVTNKTMRQITASLSASGLFPDGGGYSATAAVSTGDLNIKGEVAKLIDDVSARSNGSFSKLAYSLSAVVPLSRSWSMLASANGQVGNKNLDSSEKFSLGGADAVRAYPQGEATGDDGFLLSSEIRYAFPVPGPSLMLLGAFIDYGVIKINHSPYLSDENKRRLSAIGLSLNWSMPDDFVIKATLARKLGTEASTADLDRSYRFWLQGVKSF
ncbi:MAG: ShlB/FhaC/HecB family hemolysin secretion/activation protein [Janthinobacterium lividum]